MTCRAEIVAVSAGTVTLAVCEEFIRAVERTGAKQADLRPVDPREHSREQHGKVFALCADISAWSGHGKTELIFWHWVSPEEARYALTDEFCAQEGLERFSMADVDMETCRDFITFLVDFCLVNAEHGLHTKQPLGKLAEDAERYIYACLLHRKCSLCGRPADLHHIDAIQMGHDRNEVEHVGRRAIALCREHHEEAHRQGVKTFFDLYHLPRGIKLDRYLCGRLGLNARPENAEEKG